MLASAPLLPAADDCLRVEGARLLASDLAGRVAAFSTLPPDADFGPAPSGTVVRIFQKAQLAALLPAAQAADLPDKLCVIRQRAPIPHARWKAALEKALTDACGPGRWRLQIREAPLHPYPNGELRFSPSGLTGTSLWRGALALPGKSTVPVWVRVDLAVPSRSPVAQRDVAAGETLLETDVEWREIWQTPPGGTGLCPESGPEWNAAGMLAARALRAGSTLRQSDLRRTPAVQRGQTVELEVVSGGARLRTAGVAAKNAEVGEQVSVTGQWNGSHVLGRVVAAGKAKVD